MGLGLCSHGREGESEAAGWLPTLIREGKRPAVSLARGKCSFTQKPGQSPLALPGFHSGISCLCGGLVSLKTKLPYHFPCREWQTPGLAAGLLARGGMGESKAACILWESARSSSWLLGLCLALPNTGHVPRWRKSSVFFRLLSKGVCMDILESPGKGVWGTLSNIGP